jgi:tRNA threonylcarbamoyladenosine biosynthesis protein TsaE
MEQGRRPGSDADMPSGDVHLDLHGPDEMIGLGTVFGRAAQAGDRFFLYGPFGAGKTTFVQGLARGLGVEDAVGSPSFVLETRYHGRLDLAHVDLYRLESIEAGLLAELEELLFGETVTAVEWPEHLPEGLRAGATELTVEVTGANDRRVTVHSDAEHLTAALRATRT